MTERTPKLVGAIAFARDAFPNDGAEGETVHLLCDAVEFLTRERDEAIKRAKSAEAARDAAIDCGEVCGTVGKQCQRCLREMFHREVARAESAEKLLGELIRLIPDTYGEAVQSGIVEHGECENHEWDNRTRAENAVWLIRRRTQELDEAREALERERAAIAAVKVAMANRDEILTRDRYTRLLVRKLKVSK